LAFLSAIVPLAIGASAAVFTLLCDYLGDTVLSERALGRGLLRREAVLRLASEHASGERDHGQALLTLLILEVWHQVFLDGALG